jgi:hypothetical protein
MKYSRYNWKHRPLLDLLSWMWALYLSCSSQINNNNNNHHHHHHHNLMWSMYSQSFVCCLQHTLHRSTDGYVWIWCFVAVKGTIFTISHELKPTIYEF